jgi:hypothetical protein
MKRILDHSQSALVVGIIALICLPAAGAQIWTGPRVSFSRLPGGSPLDEVNQDRITPNVWLTRAETRGIFNAAQEGFYTNFASPADTEWAVGTTADLGSLVFDTWEGTVGIGTAINGPPSSVGIDMVVHLISEDIYLDLTFTSWGVGFSAGGAFSYERSTAIPEPGTAALVALALAVAFPARFRRPAA